LAAKACGSGTTSTDSRKSPRFREGKNLPGAAGPHGLDQDGRGGGRESGFGAEPEARRNAVLEDFENRRAFWGLDPALFIVVVMGRPMTVAAPMPVRMAMLAAGKQPGAGDIDQKSERGDRNRLGEMDRHRREQAADRLVADQERDHRQNEGAGKARQIAELSGAEGEARILRVAARKRIGERRQQQGAGVRAHVQPVGD